ncbi:hypothetical protein M1506_03130 [Patescibacteria group bacterium]|nr:hypothetical protein [Patescibacteria group bacterium]
MNEENKEVVWEAPEFDQVEKGAGWYLVFGLIFLGLLIFGWLSKNFLFLIFIILSGLMIVAFSKRTPKEVRFKLDEDGFSINKMLYRFSDMSGFAVVERGSKTDLLVLRRNVVTNPYLKVPLVKDVTEEVRIFLKTKLKEGTYEETLVDTLIDFIGL